MNIQISLEVSSLFKSFKNNLIFADAAMTAVTGDIIAIMGENGCGKSTLLSILAGITKTNSGEIVYKIGEKSISEFELGNYVSFVPQNNYLLDDLSVYDNLIFWYKGNKHKLYGDLKAGIIKELGIDKFVKIRVSKLSVGMKKRVALACALASNPKVLLLDEISAPLDIKCKFQIRKLLNNYAKSGNIVVFATHDEGDLSICNKVYYITENQICDVSKNFLKDMFEDKLWV